MFVGTSRPEGGIRSIQGFWIIACAFARLTAREAPSIVHGISTESRILANSELDQLELQIDALIRLNERLRDENASLRVRQETLVAERSELIEKTEQARSRVEAMLSRLRAMEENL
ncbi:TIGR02449 family protein [Thiocystis violacea]|nr:TIGR02449 family protein [Thiocystis violacea]